MDTESGTVDEGVPVQLIRCDSRKPGYAVMVLHQNFDLLLTVILTSQPFAWTWVCTGYMACTMAHGTPSWWKSLAKVAKLMEWHSISWVLNCHKRKKRISLSISCESVHYSSVLFPAVIEIDATSLRWILCLLLLIIESDWRVFVQLQLSRRLGR